MYSPYTLYKRKTGKKSVYYVRFRDPVTGERLTAKSTGSTTKAEADRFALNLLTSGQVKARSKLAFGSIVKDFFDWEKSSYIKHMHDTGKRYSRAYSDKSNGILKNHILPVFKDKLITEITVEEIELFLGNIQKTGVTYSNLNAIRNTLNAIFTEVHRKQLIKTNPMDSVDRYSYSSRQKGLMSTDLIKDIFNPLTVADVWKNRTDLYLINLLAATTGMRQGEIQALQYQDIKSNHVEVHHSWDRKYGLKPPKYDSYRLIPMPDTVSSLLHQFISLDAEATPNQFVFHGNKKEKPIDHKVIDNALYNALCKIGIDSTKREEMNMTFHSWRHTFASLMRTRVEDSTLKLLTGHRTDEMLEHYSQYSDERVSHVRGVENTLFSGLLGT
jgi:integrase